MKILRLLVFVIVVELLTTHAALAKTNHTNKATQTQKTGKLGNTTAARKSGSSITGTGISGTTKNTSAINGTGLHRKR